MPGKKETQAASTSAGQDTTVVAHFLKKEYLKLNGEKVDDMKSLEQYQGKEFILDTQKNAFDFLLKDNPSKVVVTLEKKKFSLESYNQK